MSAYDCFTTAGYVRVLDENPATGDDITFPDFLLDNEYQKRMDPFASMAPSAAQEQADAQAALNAAENDAAALLAELEAKDAANATAATVHNVKYQMPSKYAPGEDPAERDPVQSVQNTMPRRISAQEAAEKMFKPVGDTAKIRDTTLPMTHKVDFAQKIRDAQKFKGSH